MKKIILACLTAALVIASWLMFNTYQGAWYKAPSNETVPEGFIFAVGIVIFLAAAGFLIVILRGKVFKKREE